VAAAASAKGALASIRAWSRRWQPPHPPPAWHRAVTSATLRAPEATTASMVRSVIALQWQTYIPYTPVETFSTEQVTCGTPEAMRSAASDRGMG
jgi:hypothetical protein